MTFREVEIYRHPELKRKYSSAKS